MSYQNNFSIDQITPFTNSIADIVPAIDGKWAKYKGINYKLIIVRDVCFINTFGDCKIELPQHYPFKYEDDSGKHTVQTNENTIEVKGITNFFFTIKEINR